MAISDITKPMALDETLQATNGKMDSVITKLQGIIDALGLDTSVYKPKGNIACAQLVPALLIESNIGNVYNVTDNGTTTSDFAEGAGKPIHVGDNVAIVDVGTGGQSEYKFDLLAGMVDLTNYIQKSNTSGLVKNDGTVDTKDYAEKVAGATSGNLAGLNGSGNLTDSTWSADKTTQSATGNPISIPNLKANQLAENPIITLEPIQAGSGTPSPSNIRAISGYDKIEVLSCGVNLIFDYEKGGIDSNTGADNTNVNACRTGYIRVSPNTSYYFIRDNSFGGRMYPSEYDSGKNYLRDLSNFDAETRTITTSADCHYIRIAFFLNNSGWGTNLPNRKDGLNYPATQTSYVAPVKATSISESLGQTVYGATWYPRTGKLANIMGIIDAGDIEWIRVVGTSYVYFQGHCTGKKANNTNFICSQYRSISSTSWVGGLSDGDIAGSSSADWVVIRDDAKASMTASEFKTAMAGVKICFELATPTEIQLTPHEISLLKDYAYVSTNGTNIALDYHNGELASLADVAQLSQTVEELDRPQERTCQIDITSYNTSTNRYSIPFDGYITAYLPQSTSIASVMVTIYDHNEKTLGSHRDFTINDYGLKYFTIYVKRGMKAMITASSGYTGNVTYRGMA